MTNDDCFDDCFNDCFRVKDDGLELSTLSMGACLDLLPVLGKLLDSKYEEYELTCLDKSFSVWLLSKSNLSFRGPMSAILGVLPSPVK